MKKLLFNIIILLLLAGAKKTRAQAASYGEIKQKAREMGFKVEKRKLIDLRQGEFGYASFTAKPGRSYKIFGFPKYSTVEDIDLWVYDEDNKSKLIGKDLGDDPVGTVEFSVAKETRISVKIKNVKTDDDKSYGCYILITQKKLR